MTSSIATDHGHFSCIKAEYGMHSMAIERTAGFFAREVLKRFSQLTVEDELRLINTRIRDHFLTSIFTLAAFREMEKTRDPEALADFMQPTSSS